MTQVLGTEGMFELPQPTLTSLAEVQYSPSPFAQS